MTGFVEITVPPNPHNPLGHQLSGEHISDHLAVTPIWIWSRVDGQWSGRFGVTHVPSGALMPGLMACVHCARRAADRMAAVPVDWPRLTSDPDQNELIVGDQSAVLREIAGEATYGCTAEMCPDPSCRAGDQLALAWARRWRDHVVSLSDRRMP